MELLKECTATCTQCHRKITYLGIENNKEYKPKICAECNFYRSKNVQNIIFVICICSILFSVINFLHISKKIQIILSFIFFGLGIFMLIFYIVLKIKSKHKVIYF